MDVSSCEVSSLSVDWSILIGFVSLFSEDGLDGVELLVVFELVVLVFVFVLLSWEQSERKTGWGGTGLEKSIDQPLAEIASVTQTPQSSSMSGVRGWNCHV